MRQGQMPPLGPGGIPMHERRTSSQSMHGGSNFVPQNGRGRGFPQQPYGMPSPGPQNFRASTGAPPRGQNMPQQFQGSMPPGSPYMRGRNSPALPHQQPNMPQHMQPNQQMGYGYGMPSQGYPNPNMYSQFDPSAGYYPPYYQGGYPPQPSPGPRGYPTPYQQSPGPMGPPFNPPHGTTMSRTPSAASERPTSALGQPSTPSMGHAPPSSQTPVSGQQAQPGQGNQFVRPKKTSSAIQIKDPNSGNTVNFSKSSPAPSATTAPPEKPSGPVIVSTPGVTTSTPPPRVPSGQHNRNESKSTKTAEETRKEFQESIRRQMEQKKNGEAVTAKPEKEEAEVQPSQPKEVSEPAEKEVIKEATAEVEKAAAVAAGDKAGEEAAAAALTAVDKEDDKKTEKEETEDERLEREIAEMEAKEREEEEREKAYQEKKRKEKEANASREAEEQAKRDEELKRQEREAEELEEQKERERAAADKGGEDTGDEGKDLFAQLKKPTLGPGASAPGSGAETPASEEAEPSPMPPPAQPASGSLARPTGTAAAAKPKPAHLKLETTKRVEPAEPTPGMQALKSARFLTIKEEAKYPDGFKSPNPALNVNGTRKGKAYDKDFLLQFQSVFKEKPSVDWDQKVRETLGPGDEPGSARPGSARTPSSNMGRSASGRPQQPIGNFGGAMGQFGGLPNRTLPPGTTSAQRFEASQQTGRPGMGMPGPMGGRGPSFGMPQPVGMSRTNSLQQMGNLGGPNSPRIPSARGGKGGSRRGDRAMSKKEEAELAAKMPLTAHLEVKGLEKSTSGWKPTSIGGPAQSEHDVNGNLTPDLVQRKVKAALNKMTPENFDKISNQILDIAAQSKNETDGRTLRQVIQLTFEKATDEAHWAGMYAQFCLKMLTAMSPEIRDETIKDKAGNPVVGGALFRKYLLNRCQEDFEQGWQANLPQLPEGSGEEVKLLSDEYYAAAAAKRRGLGLIQFIGQLYILRMLTLRIMHECVMRLLNFEGEPDEAAVENLTTLLRSVGGTMEEEEKGAEFMNMYFERINSAILNSAALGSRPRFMILDLLDLRKAGWKGKNDNKGPKTIAQIHQEAEAAAAKAEAERLRTNQRGGPGGRPPPGRGDIRSFSGGGMPPPVDHTRNTVGMDDLRRLQNRGASNRPAGGGLGPGGNLGPGSLLGGRTGSRRGAGNLGPGSSGNTTRTNTPPVGDKKEEATSTNAFK